VGGIEEVVTLEIGFLAEPGNVDQLAACFDHCILNPQDMLRLSDNAFMEFGKKYGQEYIMEHWIDLWEGE
jgi:glycosyltransferase involved in cell wall biosynthesis